MARATNKEELKQATNDNFNKLFVLIDSLSKAEQEGSFPFEDRDRNIRDVLVHLYEWHLLLLNWVKSNKSGTAVPFLPEAYNWKTYPQMNVEFWKKHQHTPYSEARQMLQKSHSDVLNCIDTHTNDELFTKKYFPWTGTTSLGSYCISATSSHYDWAIKKIKHYKNALVAK